MRNLTARYPWTVVAVLQVVTLVLGAVVIVHLTDRAIRAETRARQESAEQTRRANCVVIAAQDAAYRDTPPATPTGQNVAAAWHSLSVYLHCDK